MSFKTWYKKRGSKFIYQRGKAILKRQGIFTEKSMLRVENCVDTLANLGCSPTLPTPGDIVNRYPKFIQKLQDKGVEIAVHSYHHKNLSEIPLEEALQQLERAVKVFAKYDIDVHGFRCPYLGHTADLIESIPQGLFKYSSNKAIFWKPKIETPEKDLFYVTLDNFYQGENSENVICAPQLKENLIEIPVCVPDDLQLMDGLKMQSEDVFQEWKSIQNEIYRRGELFTILFHPELAHLCNNPFLALLDYIQASQPAVWVAKLSEISDWWLEKAKFSVEIIENNEELIIKIISSPRATILFRNHLNNTFKFWDGNYWQINGSQISIPKQPRPFIGLEKDVPESIVSFLQEQGYIIDQSEKAYDCSLFFDHSSILGFQSPLSLVEFIESKSTPLLRFGRWPNGAKSAFCLSGDLDVLSLFDYAARVFY